MCTLVNGELDADRRTEALAKRVKARRRGWSAGPVRQWVLVVAIACLVPVHYATAAQDSAAAPRHHGSRLDDRVRILSQALDLDAPQQSELRKLLEEQREQIKKIWSDASVPAVYRVSATQAVSDKTADQIRALLNEEQKKRYKLPRQRDAANGSTTPSVEEWMNLAKPKLAGAAADR